MKKMVSYTRFRTKPLQEEVKKVSYKRFRTELFQNDAQKVLYKWFRMIPSWKYGNQGFVKTVSEEINPFRVNPQLWQTTSKCLNRGGPIRSSRNIKSLPDYKIITSKSTIKYFTTHTRTGPKSTIKYLSTHTRSGEGEFKRIIPSFLRRVSDLA